MMLSIMKNLLSSYHRADDFYSYVLQITQKFYLIPQYAHWAKTHKLTKNLTNPLKVFRRYPTGSC